MRYASWMQTIYLVKFILFVFGGNNSKMRNIIKKQLNKELRELAIKERARLGYTQEKMAETLLMSTRSYSDIESGEIACGSLTTIILLMNMNCPDEYLKKLKNAFEKLQLLEEMIV